MINNLITRKKMRLETESSEIDVERFDRNILMNSKNEGFWFPYEGKKSIKRSKI